MSTTMCLISGSRSVPAGRVVAFTGAAGAFQFSPLDSFPHARPLLRSAVLAGHDFPGLGYQAFLEDAPAARVTLQQCLSGILRLLEGGVRRGWRDVRGGAEI